MKRVLDQTAWSCGSIGLTKKQLSPFGISRKSYIYKTAKSKSKQGGVGVGGGEGGGDNTTKFMVANLTLHAWLDV